MKKQTESPVIQLLRIVWKHSCAETSHSWERINHSMREALYLCIGAGLPFEADDFRIIDAEFRPGYWLHREYPYQLAVIVGNLSACQAYEQYVGRPPFIADEVELPSYGHMGYCHLTGGRARGRLAVDFTFRYGTERPKVTSFSDDGTKLVACTYRNKPSEYPRKVKKPYRITPADIQRDRAERKRRQAIWEELERLSPVTAMIRLKAIGVTAREEFDRCAMVKLEAVLREVSEAAQAGGDQT